MRRSGSIPRSAGASVLALLLLATPAQAATSESCQSTAEGGWFMVASFPGTIGGSGEVISVNALLEAGDVIVATAAMLSGPDTTFTLYLRNVEVGTAGVGESISAVVAVSERQWVGGGTPAPFEGQIEITVACYSADGLAAMIDACVPDGGLATALHNQVGGPGSSFDALLAAHAGRRISTDCAERLATANDYVYGGG
ncbi:MAG: hypothetical protein ACRDHD_00070 [Candidatus Limnocylindria bacterium]